MASSGSNDFSLTAQSLIEKSLRVLKVLHAGQTASTDQLTEGLEFLNIMTKAWQADGLQLWAIKEAIIFLDLNTSSFALGPGGDHASESYINTEVLTAAISGASTIDVDSITGISASDNIGIELDDGTIQWTTVNGAPAGSTITLTVALTDTVAVDNQIFTYTNLIDRPLKIIEIVRRDKDENDIPVQLISRQEYHELTNKTNDGAIVQAYYEPSFEGGDPATATGTLYVWNESDNVTDTLVVRYHRPFEDFDATTDTPDFPQEWYMALMYGLADMLSDGYEVSPIIKNRVAKRARVSKEEILDWDTEDTSVYIQPDPIGQDRNF
jgi:hypothetical protein